MKVITICQLNTLHVLMFKNNLVASNKRRHKMYGCVHAGVFAVYSNKLSEFTMKL